METKPQSRLNYLDWLRVLGMLLVFVFHTTRLYNFEDWNIKNDPWYPTLEIWISFSSTFMMPLMFAVSGSALYFAAGKGGFLKYLKDKSLRLLVPLLVGALTHLSLQSYFWEVSHGHFSGSFLQFLPWYYQLDHINWVGGHLWYLYYLFLYSLILYPLLHWWKGSGSNLLSRFTGWVCRPWALYLLGLPLLLMRALLPEDFPLMEENGGFPYLIYLFFLLWGFVVVSDGRLQERLRQLRWTSLGLGMALAVGFSFFYYQIANPDVMSPSLVLAGLMRYLGGWISLLAFYGLGIHFLNYRTPRLDYANEAVLPFYILHQTMIQLVAFFLLPLGIPDLLEWVIVLVVSFAVIMGIYELLIRRWNPVRVLFGMKAERRDEA